MAFPWSLGADPTRAGPKDDLQDYRDGYPGKEDNKDLNANLKFYKGLIRSKPDGVYIDQYHKTWAQDMDRLEAGHDYIQWLFPVREPGMNQDAQELQLHEAEGIQKDNQAIQRFVRSYEMMLHFYGMKLVSYETGGVTRANNWREQFANLNHSEHNFLRITRILKSLGEMGLERYKMPLIQFLLTEAIATRELWNTLDSCHNYWIPTLRDPQQRERLKELAKDLAAQRSKR
jgi:hypothetical protein